MECVSVCECNDHVHDGVGAFLHSADVGRAALLRVLLHALPSLLLLPLTVVVVAVVFFSSSIYLLLAKQRIVFVCHNNHHRRVETLQWGEIFRFPPIDSRSFDR